MTIAKAWPLAWWGDIVFKGYLQEFDSPLQHRQGQNGPRVLYGKMPEIVTSGWWIRSNGEGKAKNLKFDDAVDHTCEKEADTYNWHIKWDIH